MRFPLPIILCILCILVTLILIRLWMRRIHIRIGSPTTVFGDPAFVKALTTYAEEIHPDTLVEKCGNPTSYIQGFRTCILEGDHVEVKERLHMIHKTLPHSPLLSRSPQYLLVSDRLEYGMPFTLANWVILPKSLIDQHSVEDLANTLCHEQMHILQWKYPQLHHTCNHDVLGYREVQIQGPLPVLPFANPDGPQTPKHSWVFENNGHTYCPHLTMDKPYSLQKVGIRIRKLHGSTYQMTPHVDNLAILMQNRFPSCPIGHRYHPYEILAELGAQYILKGTTGIPELNRFYEVLASTASSG